MSQENDVSKSDVQQNNNQTSGSKSSGAEPNGDIRWSASYSGKAFRFQFLVLFLFTIACILFGILMRKPVKTAFNENRVFLWWFVCMIIPVVLWVRYLIVCLYRKWKKTACKWTLGSVSYLVVLILITVVMIWIACMCPKHPLKGYWWPLCLAVPAIFWIYSLIVYFYMTMTIHYQLESDRLITRKGLFTVRSDTLFVLQIKDLSMTQTLWDRIFNGGIGTICLYTSDITDGTLLLKGVDRPKEAYEAIDQARKYYIRRRGIMAFGENGGVIDTDDRDDTQ